MILRCPNRFERQKDIDPKIARAQDRINALKERCGSRAVPRADRNWGGANVIISDIALSSGYREIITSNSLEVSWLFDRLKDAFTGIIDSVSKYEFYGRLEISANQSLQRGESDSQQLCLRIVEEAELMLSEMSRRQFQYHTVAEGTAIAADDIGNCF